MQLRVFGDFPGGTVDLPGQETQVRYLVREDSTCLRATRPMCRNYWACVSQLLKPTFQILNPAHLEPVLCNKKNHRNEQSKHWNRDETPLTTTRQSLHKKQQKPSAAKKEVFELAASITLLQWCFLVLFSTDQNIFNQSLYLEFICIFSMLNVLLWLILPSTQTPRNLPIVDSPFVWSVFLCSHHCLFLSLFSILFSLS